MIQHDSFAYVNQMQLLFIKSRNNLKGTFAFLNKFLYQVIYVTTFKFLYQVIYITTFKSATGSLYKVCYKIYYWLCSMIDIIHWTALNTNSKNMSSESVFNFQLGFIPTCKIFTISYGAYFTEPFPHLRFLYCPEPL